MADPRWNRLKELHERVFELPLEQAKRIVASELADDPDLMRELVSILEQKNEGTQFLRTDQPTRRTDALPPHTRLGDYEILYPIGHGGMGTVYRARQLRLDRDVALKVLSSALSTNQSHVDRFRREARRLAQFSHPGIVPIFDVQSHENVHYFTMEVVDGLDLHRELVCLRGQVPAGTCRTSLPAADSKEYFPAVAGIVRQAALALADAHAHGITHRDIKPHNLILGRDGRLRIVDFGIARDQANAVATEKDEPSGTLYYMSPEQARFLRNAKVDHRTDIYSLGVVMYELLTLVRPFDGPTQREILKAIEDRQPRDVRDANPRAPRDLAVICHQAMEKLPADRYDDARQLADDLGRYLAGEPIHAAPPNAWERARRALRRRRVPLAAAAVVAVGVSAGYLLRGPLRAQPGGGLLRVSRPASAAAQPPWRVRYAAFDPLRQVFGTPREWNAAEPEQLELPAGVVRFTIDYPGGASREVSIEVLASAEPISVELPGPPERTAASADPGAGSMPGMVLIPGGVLRRRSDYRSTGCSNVGQDIPIAPFYVDVNECTVGAYRAFLSASGRPPPKGWELIPSEGFENRPCVLLSYADMRDYALAQGKRLLTHAEWEWVARGANDWRTPSGVEYHPALRAAIHGVEPGYAATPAELIALWKDHTRDVGTQLDDVTPLGVFDLLGNVHEAVEGAFVNVLPPSGPEPVPGTHWIVGGGWYSGSDPMLLDSHAFAANDSVNGNAATGFRCAMSSMN